VTKAVPAADEPERILERISAVGSVAAGAGAADLVIDAVPEEPELKYDLFARLDAASPAAAIPPSNTSSISITQTAALSSLPESVMGMHFMNPVPVMPLVEVIRGLATGDRTAAAVFELARELGKTLVEVKDFPGFVSN